MSRYANVLDIEGSQIPARPVRKPAFLAALLAAPVSLALVALGIFWLAGKMGPGANGLAVLAFFPVAAAILGAPTYLVFGGPAFWMALRREFPTALAGFLANLLSLPFVVVVSFLFADPGEVRAFPILNLTFGSLFAPLWGWIFGVFYRRFSGGSSDV